MPSVRGLASAGCLAATLGLSGVAAAQPADPGAGLGLGTRVAIGFAVTFVLYLLLGGAMVALSPNYTNNRVTDIRDEPGEAFGWGLIVGIGVPILLVLLAITIIGLIVTIPGMFVLFVVSLAGTGVTVVWAGTLVGGDGRGRVSGRDALVGAFVLAVPGAIPVIGTFLVQVVSLFGIGVVGRNFYESWAE